MAIYNDREAFIPYQRTDLIEMCIEDGQLAPEAVQPFREFCQILAAYYHFKLHHFQELLKQSFSPFNPDTDTKPRQTVTKSQLREMQTILFKTFEQLLKKANYTSLSKTVLQQAFDEDALISVETEVEFNDYEETLIYYRGDHPITITEKQFYIRTVERTFDVYDRVVFLLKFKDKAYFEAKGDDIEALPFTPGKIYLSLYKNIPKFDLELLFPNIKVSMSQKDRVLFGLPAIGAAATVVIKVLPSFTLVLGVLLLMVLGESVATQTLGVTHENSNDTYLLLTTVLTAVIALGGYAVKQYNSYKNKYIKFQKDVTETLFFRNLVNNAGVFHGIIDAAEEEETKEIILIYYHLLIHPKPLTSGALDDAIETWFEEKFATKVDFDIEKALANLAEIQGEYIDPKTNRRRHSTVLLKDEQNQYTVLPLDATKTIVDYMWDNLFEYN